MIKTSHIYYHPHLNHYVQVTEQQGNWVEFLTQGTTELRWLEQGVFSMAYRYYNVGDPVRVDLKELRQDAHRQGILVPREFA